MTETTPGPLAGLKILDIATIIAGPWSATLLADLGAEVLKVELPGHGDGLRDLAPHQGDVPLWWKVANRNKAGITLDLRKERGRALLLALLPRFDVIVENFRPGTLDSWGLSREVLQAVNPRLTILRVSGFGQTGPMARRPAFARIAEAMAGFTHICGEAEGPPLHAGFPVADAIAGLFGAIGVLAALHRRDRDPEALGQEIDVNLVESMLRILDFLPIEFDRLGRIRGRSGNLSQYAAPGNIFRTRDDKWITLPASSEKMFRRLCRALGRDDLSADPRFATNQGRIAHREEIDRLVAEEIRGRSRAEVLDLLYEHEVGVGPVNTIADIVEDPHLAAREALIRVEDAQLGSVLQSAVHPRFSETPGAVRCNGPDLGADNREIFTRWLGLDPSELAALVREGVI